MVFILFNVEKQETKQKQGDVSVINNENGNSKQYSQIIQSTNLYMITAKAKPKVLHGQFQNNYSPQVVFFF
jgi:hypothetical protein